MAIQTKTFSYGSLSYGSATKSYVLELTVQELSVSAQTNTSQIQYVLKLISGSNNRFSLYHIGATLWLGGVVAAYRDGSSSEQISLDYNSSAVLLSGSVSVSHNADGTLTMPVAFSIDMEDGIYVPGPLYASGYTMHLTAIPRQSSVGATDADIGAVSMVAVTKQAESFSHSIAYQFGALSGYVTAQGETSDTEWIFENTSIAFRLPESFYAQIPNAPSGVCTLTVHTYADGALVGQNNCTFTATANSGLCAPEVGWNLTDVNETTKALTGDHKKLIRYFSAAHCELQVNTKHEATLREAVINGKLLETTAWGYGTCTVNEPHSAQIPFSAVDSRGYSCSGVMSAEMIPYIKLTGRAEAAWTDITAGTAALKLSGAYYAGSFGAADNHLSVFYRPVGGQDYIQVTDYTIADDRYSVRIPLSDLDYRQEYGYEILVQDALMEYSQTVVLRKGMPVFHWGAEDFQFCVPVGMKDNAIKQVHSVNGVSCGGVAFADNTEVYIPIKDRTLMLFGLAGNTGGHALYLVMLHSPDNLQECVRLSGTLNVDFSLASSGVLKVTCGTKWSYGWYIKNSDFADIYEQ